MRPPIDTKDLEAVCSLCGAAMPRTLKGRLPLEEDVVEGTVNWFEHGYSSDFDGETWLLCLCNACLQKMHPLKIWDYFDQKEVEDT